MARAALAVDGPAAEPRRVDHHDGPQPRHRPAAPRVVARRPPRPGRAAPRAEDERRSGGGIRCSDDRLRLIFTCCHPALAPSAQVALTLRLLGGLQTPEIARAFLVRGADDGAAPRAGQAQDPRREHPVPRPDDAELADRLRPVLRRRLPHLQRGLHRDRAATRSTRADLVRARRSGSAACSPS